MLGKEHDEFTILEVIDNKLAYYLIDELAEHECPLMSLPKDRKQSQHLEVSIKEIDRLV